MSGTVFKVERGPAGEKIAYVRHVLRHRASPRPAAVRPSGRAARAKVTAISVFDGGAAVRRQAVSAGQIARLWGLAEIRIGDALGAPPRRRRSRAPVRAADAGDRRRAARPARQRRAARRARPARRAGPADQPAAGRRPAGDSPSRSTARCRRRSSRPRWPATSASRSASARRRRSASSGPPAPAPRSSSCTSRPNPFLATVGLRVEPGRAGSGVAVPARGRARLDAVRVLPRRRGHRAGDAAPGPARLAGHRLRGHDDALRLPGASRATRHAALRQEHVQHGRATSAT